MSNYIFKAIILMCTLFQVWSLSKGILLRNIMFPSMIYAIALDPGEHVFYAGSRDGKIYVAALNAESSPNDAYGMYIIGLLADHRFVIILRSLFLCFSTS